MQKTVTGNALTTTGRRNAGNLEASKELGVLETWNPKETMVRGELKLDIGKAKGTQTLSPEPTGRQAFENHSDLTGADAAGPGSGGRRVVPGLDFAQGGALPNNADRYDQARNFVGDFASLEWFVGTSASNMPGATRCCQFHQAVPYIDFVQHTAGIWRIDPAFVREAKLVFARNVRWEMKMMVADEYKWQRFLMVLDRYLSMGMAIPVVMVTLEIEEELPAAHPARIVPA